MSGRLALSITLGCLFCAVAVTEALPLLAQETEFATLANSLYTRNATRAVKAKIMVLRVDQKFNADERQKILNAVVVWNYVLNGYIRFEVDPVGFGETETKIHAAADRITDWIIVLAAAEERNPDSQTRNSPAWSLCRGAADC